MEAKFQQLLRQAVQTMFLVSDLLALQITAAFVLQCYACFQPLIFIVRGQENKFELELETLILRPELFILDLIIRRELFYLFALVPHLGFLAAFALFSADPTSFDRWKHKPYLALFGSTLALYQHLYVEVWFGALFFLCFESIIHDTTLYHSGLASLTILTLLIYFLLTLKVYRESITYKLNHLERLEYRDTDLWILFLKLLQFAVYLFVSANKVYLFIQALLLIAISLLSILSQLHSQTYIFKHQRYIIYTVCSVNLFYSILKIIDSLLHLDELVLLVLIAPLLVALLVSYDSLNCDLQLLHLYRLAPTQKSFLSLIKFLNQADVEAKHIPMKSAFIYLLHRKSCLFVDCLCKATLFLGEPQYTSPITANMNREFTLQALRFIKPKSKTIEQAYRYAILLYSFGFIVQSFKTFNQVMQKQHLKVDRDLLKDQTGNYSGQKSIFSNLDSIDETLDNCKINAVQQTKIQYLLIRGKKFIKSTFGSSLAAARDRQLTSYIKYYLTEQVELTLIHRKILDAIQLRIKFYDTLSKESSYYSLYSQISRLSAIEQSLEHVYNKTPSVKIMNLLCYFESQVMNNYYKAFDLTLRNLQAANEINKFTQFIHANVGAGRFGYIIVSVNEDLQNLTLEHCSSDFQAIYGLAQTDRLPFLRLVPLFMRSEHPVLIQRFLENGKSQYFRNFGVNYMRKSTHLIQKINFCLDQTQLFSSEKLMFAAFIQEIMDNESIVIFDSQLRLAGISRQFLLDLAFSEETINNATARFDLNTTKAESMLPAFHNYFLVEEAQQVNKHLYFLDLRLLDSVSDQSQLAALWDIRDWKIEFEATYTIIKRELFEFCYYIVQFSSITPKLSQQTHIVRTPKGEQAQELNWAISDEEEEGRLKGQINVLDVNDLERYVKDQNLENVFAVREHQLKQVQVFYANQEEKVKQHWSEASGDIEAPQFQSSLNSSRGVNIFRDSKYYQTFRLLNQMLVRRTPKQSNNLLGLLLLLQGFLLIFNLIIMTSLQQDFAAFIKELSIIGIHADIMGPHDLFFSMRITISSYSQLQVANIISKQREQELTDVYYDALISLGYRELEKELLAQIQNDYIQEVLDSNYFQIYFQQSTPSLIEPKWLSLRSTLQAMLQYQFAYMVVYSARKSPSGHPFQTFTYANFLNLHDGLQHVADEMQVQSKARAAQVSDKWNQVWLYFMIGSFLIVLLNIYCQYAYFTCIDAIFNLHQFIDRQQLHREIDGLKKMLKAIESTQPIYEFFSLEDSFRAILGDIEASRNEVTQKSKKTKFGRYIRKSRTLMLLYFVMWVGLFVLYSTVLNQRAQLFLEKYLQTADFYRLIQDMKLSSGSLVLYKEIFMRWDNFSFFTEQDRTRLQSRIDQSSAKIRRFSILTVGIDYSDYLISQSFIEIYRSVQQEKLCDFINSDVKAYMYKYCDLAFEGALNSGLINSLAFIVNTVKTQREANNFRHRTEYFLYEQEGGQVLTRVFFNLSDHLKLGLAEITQENQAFILMLSLIYLLIVIVGLSVVILATYRSRMEREFNAVKRMVCLVPLKTLLTESQFDITIKQIVRTQQLAG